MSIFPDCGCGCKGKEQEKKFFRALILGVLFFIIANPETFTITRRIFGYRIASATGYPSMLGLLLHGLVFFLVSWGLMNIKGREKMEGWATETSNVSPDAVGPTNWTPTDSTDGKPPAAVPGEPVPKSKTLPALPSMEQPYAEWDPHATVGAVSNPKGTGTGNWQSCSCANGKQVMIMN
jgi:hypothetical protein